MLLQNIFFTAGVSEGKGGEGKGWCGGARVCQGSPIVPCIYLNDQIQSSYFHPTNRIERKTRYAKYSLFYIGPRLRVDLKELCVSNLPGNWRSLCIDWRCTLKCNQWDTILYLRLYIRLLPNAPLIIFFIEWKQSSVNSNEIWSKFALSQIVDYYCTIDFDLIMALYAIILYWLWIYIFMYILLMVANCNCMVAYFINEVWGLY